MQSKILLQITPGISDSTDGSTFFYTSCNIQTLISIRTPFFSSTIVTLIVEAISRRSLSLSLSINFHEHSSGHFDLSRPFTERHHSLLLPTRPHACQPSHRHAYRSLFRHMLATQRQHNDHDDDDDDVALQDLDKRYYPLNHASLRPSRFLFKRQQLFFFNRNIPLELSTLIFGIKEERGINGFRDHNQFSLAIYGKFLFFFFFSVDESFNHSILEIFNE